MAGVLAEAATGLVAPFLASTLRAAIERRDRELANASTSAAVAAKAALEAATTNAPADGWQHLLQSLSCNPDSPGEQCVWEVTIESEPEGLHQSSAHDQLEFRALGLCFIVHRLKCMGRVQPDDVRSVLGERRS